MELCIHSVIKERMHRLGNVEQIFSLPTKIVRRLMKIVKQLRKRWFFSEYFFNPHLETTTHESQTLNFCCLQLVESVSQTLNTSNKIW